MNLTKQKANQGFYVFLGLALLSMGLGLFLSPSLAQLRAGLKIIFTHPSLIDFDGLFYAGHFGAAFFNAGIDLLLILLIYRGTKTQLEGSQIAAALMVFGFSFYGKNLLNIWFPIFGVLLHAYRNHKTLSSVAPLAFFSTALSPIFSVLAFGTEILGPSSAKAVLVGIVAAGAGGYLTAIFAGFLPKLLDGLLLYNAGFAAGFAGMLVNSALKALGLGHDAFPYGDNYTSGSNLPLGLLLTLLFGYLIIVGIGLGGGSRYSSLFWHKSRGGNYVEQFGLGASLINLGVVGLALVGYTVFIARGQLSGPVFACIWTAAGFATNGVTLRMHLPVLAGVFLAAFFTGGVASLIAGDSFVAGATAKVALRGMLLAAIFSAGACPIVGAFGWRAGLLVGIAHCLLVPNTGILHGWMSLYNNGFSLGLLVTILNPIYSKFGKQPKPLEQATG